MGSLLTKRSVYGSRTSVVILAVSDDVVAGDDDRDVRFENEPTVSIFTDITPDSESIHSA